MSNRYNIDTKKYNVSIPLKCDVSAVMKRDVSGFLYRELAGYYARGLEENVSRARVLGAYY